MGVYSNSRFFNESFIDAPEPDLSYRGTSGANRIISEMVENDMAFFDAIIVNDIQEAYLTNAVNEGATDLLPQITAIQEATGGGIFSKIGEFLKNIWKKISGLIMSFVNKITGSLTSDNKKLVKKFKNQIDSKEDSLKKMEFKWSDTKNGSDFSFKQPIMNDGSADHAKRKKELWDYTEDVVYVTRGQGESNKSAIENLANAIKDLMDYTENTNFNYKVYGIYIDNAPIETSGLAKACHDYWFKNEETKRNAFHQYKSEIQETLENSKDKLSSLKKNKEDIDKWFKKEIDECNKIARDFGKNGTDAEYGWRTSKDDDKPVKAFTAQDANKNSENRSKFLNAKDSSNNGPYSIDGVHKTAAQVITKGANTLKNYYTKLQACTTELLNQQMSAIQFYIKQCRRVWIQAASYSANHESVLMDAIGESADFETDQLFTMFD